MKVIAVGQKSKVNGIGTAFQRHLAAIRDCAETEVYGFGEEREARGDIGYAHGGPTSLANVTRQARQIGYLVCESTELPRNYFKAFTNLDEIWTCSEYCKQVLKEHTSKPVTVIPHYATLFESTINENTPPVFLVALNGHSRILRKLPSLAIQAIKLVAPNAKLVLKLLNVQRNTTQWLLKEAQGLRVELIDKELTQDDLTNLYRRIDIVVSTHAAEGFGLHLLEAMAMGKRVVATNYGGCVDFMKEDNSYLVDYTLDKTTDDYFKGYWAVPSLRSAAEQVAHAMETHRDDKLSTKISLSVSNFSLSTTTSLTRAAL